MKTTTTNSTTIEINCKSLSFYYSNYDDGGTLTIHEKDDDESNTKIEVFIKKDDLIDLFEKMKSEMTRQLHL